MNRQRISILRKPQLSNVQWVLVSLAVIVPLGIILGLIAGRAVQPVAREQAIIAASENDNAPADNGNGLVAANDQGQAADLAAQGQALADADSAAAAQPDAVTDTASAAPDQDAGTVTHIKVQPRRGQEPASSEAPLPAIW